MCFRDHEVPLAVCALGCVLKCAAILTRLFLNQLPQGTRGHSILPDFPTCPPARAPSSYSLKWLLNTFSQLSCCVHSTPPILLTPVKRGNQTAPLPPLTPPTPSPACTCSHAPWTKISIYSYPVCPSSLPQECQSCSFPSLVHLSRVIPISM